MYYGLDNVPPSIYLVSKRQKTWCCRFQHLRANTGKYDYVVKDDKYPKCIKVL